MGEEERSVIVLDSQGDLIANIAELDVFAPGGPLHDRIVIIDPSDVEYPVSLNLFDVGQERKWILSRRRGGRTQIECHPLGRLLKVCFRTAFRECRRAATRPGLHAEQRPTATIRPTLPQSGRMPRHLPGLGFASCTGFKLLCLRSAAARHR